MEREGEEAPTLVPAEKGNLIVLEGGETRKGRRKITEKVCARRTSEMGNVVATRLGGGGKPGNNVPLSSDKRPKPLRSARLNGESTILMGRIFVEGGNDQLQEKCGVARASIISKGWVQGLRNKTKRQH